jgi:hypothetical protein
VSSTEPTLEDIYAVGQRIIKRLDQIGEMLGGLHPLGDVPAESLVPLDEPVALQEP